MPGIEQMLGDEMKVNSHQICIDMNMISSHKIKLGENGMQNLKTMVLFSSYFTTF